MSWLNQIIAVTIMNLKTVLERSGSSLVVVIGIAGSVAVMVSLLAMANGLNSTIASTGDEGRAIILREGSDQELSSGISMQDIKIIENSPGIKDLEGEPMIAGEIFTIIDLKKKGTDETSNLPLRGVQDMSFAIRPEFKIIEGVNFQPGTGQVIVGKGAADQYQGLNVGNEIDIRNSKWKVVGIFSTEGDVHESEVWADLTYTQGAFRRGASASVAIVRLENQESLNELGIFVENDPRLKLKVERQSDFYNNQSSGASSVINAFGYTVAVIMAIGALFAALNTMYSAVSTRLVEIGTLRAIGFQGSSVLFALMLESMILALFGGLLGSGIAYLVFNGYTVSTLAGGSFSQTSFAFTVTADIVRQGLILALVVGTFGGILPAWKASRQDITEALRSI
jgi:putative ABC transport system permease protein|tara:strand:+ start:2380 stop:3567 length:1188 start_codon:yes stop_codon:yes gene_type:complete